MFVYRFEVDKNTMDPGLCRGDVFKGFLGQTLFINATIYFAGE